MSQSTLDKAREVNLDTQIYGAFAEIGAGQEVARFFFTAGKASQTIAKTMSAYDMVYSDEIYGREKNGRYVCESRLIKMLDKEFSLLQRRLEASRGDKSCFFAFANTVATADNGKGHSHGWMGVRFQTEPKGPINDIVMHIRTLDKYRMQKQESLGVVGVNLIHTAFRCLKKTDSIIPAIVENLKEGQVAIDFIRFSGPAVSHINNHVMNLQLVRKNLTDAVLFGPNGDILNIADEFYQKSILIQRGIFNPVTNTHLDIADKGLKQLAADFPESKPLVLFELTMNALSSEGKINEKDFLHRVQMLNAIKKHVLVSNFHLFYKIKHFVRQYTAEPMALIAGAYHLPRLFDESYYKDLDGGLLEGLGKLLDKKTLLYIYPHKDDKTCTTVKTFKPNALISKIYSYFIEKSQIKDIVGCDEASEYFHSEEVREMIKKRKTGWESKIPPQVAELIKKENLWG